jgi:hypothetical protein
MRTNLAFLHSFGVAVVFSSADGNEYIDEWCMLQDDEAATFDYIVVGSGSGAGGGVVTSRLAEAGHRTLLLDAGPDIFHILTT